MLFIQRKVQRGFLGHSMWWRLDPTPEHQESRVIGCSVQTAGNFRPRACDAASVRNYRPGRLLGSAGVIPY